MLQDKNSVWSPRVLWSVAKLSPSTISLALQQHPNIRTSHCFPLLHGKSINVFNIYYKALTLSGGGAANTISKR